MAKKKTLKAAEEKNLLCPGCKRKCLILETHPNGEWYAFHEWRREKVVSSATGKAVECTVLYDGCSVGGPIGSKHRTALPADEPF